MIKLEPYYSSKRSNGQQLLEQYLQLVADVVPFYRDDVLFGFQNDGTDEPRARTNNYRNLLSDNY